MALSYCIACDAEHLSDEHSQSSTIEKVRPRSHRGPRHLAKKPARVKIPQASHRPKFRRPKSRRPKSRRAGSRTPAAHKPPPLRASAPGKGDNPVVALLSACRQWGNQAARGLREVIDVGRIAADLSAPASHVKSAVSPRSERTAVGLLERPETIELSMLESLGFYSDADEVVISLTESPRPGVAAPVPPAAARSQVPDLEISEWRPHVIARSKLDRGRLSTLAIVGLTVCLIMLVALVASLLQAPAITDARQTSELSEAATELAGSLSRLDAVIADPVGGVAEATALLLDVDDAARDLFEVAAALPEENDLRQSAIGAAQSALAVRTALSDVLSYRLVLEPLWQSPALEGVTDSTVAAARVAEWQVALAEVRDGLPSSSQLAEHAEQVEAFIAGVEPWRVDYLDALTAGDLAAAGAATADLEGQLAILAQSGETALTEILTAADAERTRLVRALSEL